MNAASRAAIGLGANLGDAGASVLAALDELAALPHSRLLARSSLWRSAPHEAAGPDYCNAVALLDTTMTPHALLHALQRIETRHGRQRPYPNAPRTLDLDLLLYGDTQLHSSELHLPHPRLHERVFVLQPLLELWPQLQVPGRGSAASLLAALKQPRLLAWDVS